MSVTPERLKELLHHFSSALSLSHISHHDLQSLFGVMSFVTACVCPACVFMSTLLNTVRTHRDSRHCFLSDDNRSDLRWWCHFLPLHNSVSPIKTSSWIDDPWVLSTDACNTGAGGFFNRQFFHTPFPGPILHRFGHNINILKLMSIMAALKVWGPTLRGKCFILHCDNNNSVLAMNSSHPRTLGMQLCLHEIWFLSAVHDFDMTTVHIPGRHNTLADHLSHWHHSPFQETQFKQMTAPTSTTHVTYPARCFEFEIDF